MDPFDVRIRISESMYQVPLPSGGVFVVYDIFDLIFIGAFDDRRGQPWRISSRKKIGVFVDIKFQASRVTCRGVSGIPKAIRVYTWWALVSLS